MFPVSNSNGSTFDRRAPPVDRPDEARLRSTAIDFSTQLQPPEEPLMRKRWLLVLPALIGAAVVPADQSPPAQATAVPSPVERIAKLTGPESINDTEARFALKATDLGVLWDNGSGEILTAFGDSYGSGWTGPGGGAGDQATIDWRCNLLFRSKDRNLADGMTLDSAAEDRPGHAKEFLPCKKIDRDEHTVIPTAGISVGKRQYVQYMSVNYWGPAGSWFTNYSGFAYSDDNGENWTKDPRRPLAEHQVVGRQLPDGCPGQGQGLRLHDRYAERPLRQRAPGQGSGTTSTAEEGLAVLGRPDLVTAGVGRRTDRGRPDRRGVGAVERVHRQVVDDVPRRAPRRDRAALGEGPHRPVERRTGRCQRRRIPRSLRIVHPPLVVRTGSVLHDVPVGSVQRFPDAHQTHRRRPDHQPGNGSRLREPDRPVRRPHPGN